nr:tetratricopeptide repeat protein [Bacteroidota bacterium]
MKYFVILSLLFVSLALKAQPVTLDSLKNVVSELVDDTNKIDTYYKINRLYYNVNVDSALKYAEKGLELSCVLDIPAKMVHGYFITSSAYYALGELKTSDSLAQLCLKAAIRSNDQSNIMKSYYKLAINANRQNKPEALSYYLKSYEIAQKIGEDRWQAYIMRDIGLYYSALAEYDKELEFFFKAEALFKQLNDSVYLTHTYCDIAEVHRLQGNYKKALDYAERALIISNILNDQYMIARVLACKASTYSEMNEQENALKYNLQALSIYRDVGSNFYVGTTSVDIGLICLNLKKYKDARNYLNESYAIFREMGLEASMIISLHGLGKLNLAKERYSDAKISFIEAEKLSIKLGLLPQLKQTYEDLAVLYATEKNYKKSNDYLNALISIKDSIYSEQKSQQINRLETEYQLKEKEAQLELQDTQLELQESKLQKQRNLNYTIGIVATLLLMIAILASINIRRRKRLNQQLKDLDIAKSRFFTNISHEMRNPLTLIMSPLQKLAEETKKTPFHDDLQLAYTNSKKLLDRVNEILDLSKLEAGKMQIHETGVKLYNLCHRIFFGYESFAQYRKIRLNFHFNPDKNIQVSLDIEKFEKILNNLILNAFKHTGVEGEVGIDVEQENGTFLFRITDSGEGISPGDLPHIFDRYYQSQQKNMQTKGGTGVGLTLALEYARLFGGDIKVESSPGKGATFTLHIPLKLTVKITAVEHISVDPAIPEEVTDKPVLELKTDNDKPAVLIVEDNLEISRYLDRNLSGEYQCKTAPDGNEALKILEKQKFDLIISDVMLPNMDGFEFRERVRQNRDWRQYPFVMLTARVLEEDRIAGFQLGVDDYIAKPFNLKELQARIRNLIQNKMERDKWRKENPSEPENEEIMTIEEQMLRKSEAFVLEKLDDPQLKSASLAAHLGYSQRQLERLLKKCSGFTPHAFIREIRLQKAHQLIERRQFAT